MLISNEVSYDLVLELSSPSAFKAKDLIPYPNHRLPTTFQRLIDAMAE
jgi:hypothetical protein